MIAAAKGIVLLIVAYLALVGLAQICVAVSRWFSTAGGLEGCWLMVTAAPRDQGIEMRLRQAYSQTVTAPALEGLRMAVIDNGADPETLRICRCFCEEKGVPLLVPEEAGSLLKEGK